MKRIIPLESFSRKESVDFFNDFYNPYISVTCMVDASICKIRAKEAGQKFFHRYLHAILRAVNEVDELHYRFSPEGEIVYYDRIDVITPLLLPGRSHFTTVRLAYYENLDEFIRQIRSLTETMAESSDFGAEDNLQEFDVVLLSAVPKLPFTSITSTQRHRHGNDYPLLTVGQMLEDGKMTLAIAVHHAFVDGEHLALFYEKVQKYLNY